MSDEQVEARKKLDATFGSYDEKRAFYMAHAHDFITEKLARTLKNVDTQPPHEHEPLDDWRYLLLAKAAVLYLQGKAYSR
jgi:hypothetical protein